MSLKTWADAGWIRPVEPDPEIIGRLLLGARRDLDQSQIDGLDADWRLIIAYTVILNSATAALLAAGFRSHRKRTGTVPRHDA